MRLGVVGLGKMGGNMAARLRDHEHEVVGYDRDPGRSDVADLAGLVGALDAPRLVWLMLPAGEPTASAVAELSGLLQGRRVDLITPKFLNVRIRERVLREAEPLYVAA
jgi:6-phosphogluconate dehydrogenase